MRRSRRLATERLVMRNRAGTGRLLPPGWHRLALCLRPPRGSHGGDGVSHKDRKIAGVVFLVWGRWRNPIVCVTLMGMLSSSIGAAILNLGGSYLRMKPAVDCGSSGSTSQRHA